jgi:hypothetical protein
VGASVAYGEDDDVTVLGMNNFSGDRLRTGADVRVEHGALLVSAEVIAARLSPETGPRVEPWGHHVTLGYRMSARTQGLVRFDSFDPDEGDAFDTLVLGLNVWPTQATEVQVNVLTPVGESPVDGTQLLVNVQLGF